MDPKTESISIRKQIIVECPQEHAFRVFTRGLDSWWPRDHHIGKVEMQRAVIEEKLGGRVFEIGIDGSECEWGKVIAWEPPTRFAWTWQLTAQFKYDPDFVTEVEVKFFSEGEKRTRVEFEHKNLERYGEDSAKMRDALGRGWGSTLDKYALATQR